MLQSLFPKDDFQLETSALPSVVRAKLQTVISDPLTVNPLHRLKSILMLQRERPKILYIGGFTEEGHAFALSPHQRRRRGLKITGTIEQQGGGSVVNVRIQLSPLLQAVVVLAPLISMIILLSAWLTGTASPLPLWLHFFHPILLYCIVQIGFWDNAKPAKADIERLLRDNGYDSSQAW